MASKYPELDYETVRPYRLWDAKLKQWTRWRCYLYPRKAHIAAWIETRWGKVGDVIEVVDIRVGALLGQYVRTPTAVEFHKIKRGSDADQTE